MDNYVDYILMQPEPTRELLMAAVALVINCLSAVKRTTVNAVSHRKLFMICGVLYKLNDESLFHLELFRLDYDRTDLDTSKKLLPSKSL